MSSEIPVPTRFIGLDLHKHYLVALGVDAELHEVLGPQRVPLVHLDRWMAKHLTKQDAVVLEMTTNAFQLYDELLPHVHSVTLVHPPHVAQITQAQVTTDRLAARILARLHAKGLSIPVWVPPAAQRDLRALLAQRNKLTRLATQAKNRLHAVLHRHHIAPPPGSPFRPTQREWWLHLPVSDLERVRIECDWNTLTFAQAQVVNLERCLTAAAAQDERVPLLVQLPGIGLLTAMTLLAAIGDITRFPAAKKLVGYAGLGARVHDSGLTCRRGRITKAGRRDIRTAMVEAAHVAANTHPHWQAELARLEPRLGHNKAIVAIARKLLVATWHVLTHQTADRHAQPELVARKLKAYAQRLTKANRPPQQTVRSYVHQQFNRLGLGTDLTSVTSSSNRTKAVLPKSSLAVSTS
jgi:transposase